MKNQFPVPASMEDVLAILSKLFARHKRHGENLKRSRARWVRKGSPWADSRGREYRKEFERRERRGTWFRLVAEPLGPVLASAVGLECSEVIGPFGLNCEFAIRVDGKTALTLAMHLTKDEVCVVDYSTNTGEFESGTIGARNGLNFPNFPLSSIETLDELKGYFDLGSLDSVPAA